MLIVRHTEVMTSWSCAGHCISLSGETWCATSFTVVSAIAVECSSRTAAIAQQCFALTTSGVAMLLRSDQVAWQNSALCAVTSQADLAVGLGSM